MSSLVRELQRDALNNTVDVSSLLRKAYAVATKLKLEKFKAWVGCELNGYDKTPLPSYRIISGTLRAWNPMRGWIPVFLPNAEKLASQLSTHREGSPIGPLQDLVASPNEDGRFMVPLSQRAQNWLMEGSYLQFETCLHINRSSVVGILDAVRNLVLEWSLNLEEDGILGEGMSFSSNEKDLAARNSVELQAPVNFINIGTMVGSTIQQGSSAATASLRAS